jgi:hypothetical protein
VTLPTTNRKHSLWISFASSPFAHKKSTTALLFCSTLLEHGCHFDCWNQPLNMHICYLDCHEAGLYCFHLWPIYWLPCNSN